MGSKLSHLTWIDGTTYDIHDENACPAIDSTNNNATYNILFDKEGTPCYSDNSNLYVNASECTIYSEGFYVNDSGDLAEDIEVPSRLKVVPGYCYAFDGTNYYPTRKRGDRKFIGIHSDTAGYILNNSNSNHIRVALAGFVLANVDKIYKSMTPLVCTSEGYLTKANIIDRLLNRVIAYYWKPEPMQTWHNVSVSNRHWIKIS